MIFPGRKMRNLLQFQEKVANSNQKYQLILLTCDLRFANVIKFEDGSVSSHGELTGPSKPCPSISLHSSHCILASDDKSLTVYRASPKFKFTKTLRDHEGFVQVARFSLDGKKFATAGADGRVFIYKTDTFECKIKYFKKVIFIHILVISSGSKVHAAGILSLEWIDNETILTASADKSLKLLKSSDGSILKESAIPAEWTFEKQICGILIQRESGKIVVLRLDGLFECRDIESLELIENGFKGIGHSKGVVDLADNAQLTSVSYDGAIKSWNKSSWHCEKETILPKTTVSKISSSGVIFENKLIRFDSNQIEEFPSKIIATEHGNVVVLADGSARISDKGPTVKLGFEIEIAVIKETLLAVVTSEKSLKIYNLHNNSVGLTKSFDDLAVKTTAMAFSPSARSLAVADEQRRIKVYNLTAGGDWSREPSQWCNHSARIDTLMWLNDSMILSAGVDGQIMAWSLSISNIGPVCTAKSAHSAPINKLQKLDEKLFVSAGADSCIKVWSLD